MAGAAAKESGRIHAWETAIDDEIRQIAGDYESGRGFQDRPALLCIDNYNAVFGTRPEPLLEARQRFPSSCGLAAWEALVPTKQLMAAARAAGVPVIHTTHDDLTQSRRSRLAATKRSRRDADPVWEHTFFPDLAPAGGELVIRKVSAGAFFGTPLIAHLVQMGVNQLVVCGNSTSGCVRTSVVEGFMHGFRMAVVEDGVFDRNWLSHKINLFDMHSKYADVIFLEEALAYFAGLKAMNIAEVITREA